MQAFSGDAQVTKCLLIVAAMSDLQNRRELGRGAGRGRGRKEKTPARTGREREKHPLISYATAFPEMINWPIKIKLRIYRKLKINFRQK